MLESHVSDLAVMKFHLQWASNILKHQFVTILSFLIKQTSQWVSPQVQAMFARFIRLCQYFLFLSHLVFNLLVFPIAIKHAHMSKIAKQWTPKSTSKEQWNKRLSHGFSTNLLPSFFLLRWLLYWDATFKWTDRCLIKRESNKRKNNLNRKNSRKDAVEATETIQLLMAPTLA